MNLLQVKALAEEVLAHLRTVAGPEALLAAYNRARQHVSDLRSERRRQKALQVTHLAAHLSLKYPVKACSAILRQPCTQGMIRCCKCVPLILDS